MESLKKFHARVTVDHFSFGSTTYCFKEEAEGEEFAKEYVDSLVNEAMEEWGTVKMERRSNITVLYVEDRFFGSVMLTITPQNG